jgi:tetratricopeptide (TPR) repeat protein
MRRMVMALVVVMMSAGTVFAGINEAQQLYDNKQYVEAEAEYRKVVTSAVGADKVVAQLGVGHSLRMQSEFYKAVTEYGKIFALDGTNGLYNSYAQRMVGYCLFRAGKDSEALAELQKVFLVEGGNSNDVVLSYKTIGDIYMNQKKYADALNAYKSIREIKAVVPEHVAMSYYYAGVCLEKQGKNIDAQVEFYNGCLIEGASVGILKRNFDKIQKGELGTEKYKELLSGMVLIIPATEANAEFLGKTLKSEQEKLK